MYKIIIAAILSFSMVACKEGGGTASLVSDPVQAVQEIHIFGDEISYGAGVTTSYVDILANQTGYSIVNKSRNSGSTMNNTLTMYDLDYVGSEDIVIIFIGYQDIRWYGASHPVSNTNSFFVPFLNKAYITGATVYVVSPINMKASVYASFAPFNNGSDAAMQALGASFQNEVNSYSSSRLVFIDMNSVFNPIDANLQADFQYPNETGHAIIANTLLTEMGF